MVQLWNKKEKFRNAATYQFFLREALNSSRNLVSMYGASNLTPSTFHMYIYYTNKITVCTLWISKIYWAAAASIIADIKRSVSPSCASTISEDSSMAESWSFRFKPLRGVENYTSWVTEHVLCAHKK